MIEKKNKKISFNLLLIIFSFNVSLFKFFSWGFLSMTGAQIQGIFNFDIKLL